MVHCPKQKFFEFRRWQVLIILSRITIFLHFASIFSVVKISWSSRWGCEISFIAVAAYVNFMCFDRSIGFSTTISTSISNGLSGQVSTKCPSDLKYLHSTMWRGAAIKGILEPRMETMASPDGPLGLWDDYSRQFKGSALSLASDSCRSKCCRGIGNLLLTVLKILWLHVSAMGTILFKWEEYFGAYSNEFVSCKSLEAIFITFLSQDQAQNGLRCILVFCNDPARFVVHSPRCSTGNNSTLVAWRPCSRDPALLSCPSDFLPPMQLISWFLRTFSTQYVGLVENDDST